MDILLGKYWTLLDIMPLLSAYKKTLTTRHTLYIGFLLSQVHKQNRYVESEASRHGQNLNGCFSQGEIAMLTIKITALRNDGHK